jgi:hypothetical protein
MAGSQILIFLALYLFASAAAFTNGVFPKSSIPEEHRSSASEAPTRFRSRPSR